MRKFLSGIPIFFFKLSKIRKNKDRFKDCNRWILNKDECSTILTAIEDIGEAVSDELRNILSLGIERDGLICIHPDLEYDFYDYLNEEEESEEESSSEE